MDCDNTTFGGKPTVAQFLWKQSLYWDRSILSILKTLHFAKISLLISKINLFVSQMSRSENSELKSHKETVFELGGLTYTKLKMLSLKSNEQNLAGR